ncbi:MAG: winged helix-turn-helix transcriptional regulator [Acidimicrobiia bacterium]|nr:winged helix-turn-helix transcriptional regulator [Acidimicrobiia bacterium]
MLTRRQEEILDMIRANPLVSQQELADQLGISRSAVAGHVRDLTELGLIRGRGYLLNDADYVCVVGGANVDIEGRVPGPLLFGDSNPGTMTRSPGGVGRNIAENLARLDVPTRLITALGRDHDGTWLHDQTAGAGVDLADSLWSHSSPTATYLSVLDGSGEMAVAVNDMAVMEALDVDALSARRDTLAHAAAVVVDCNLAPESIGHLVDELTGGPLFVDPVSSAKAARVAPHLASVHTLKPNRAEAALLSGVEITGKRSLKAAAAALLDAGVQQVVISLGPDGVFFADAETSGTLAPSEQAVASVTGAGDALMAGLVHAHLAGLPTAEAVRFGLAAAVLTAASASPVAGDFSAQTINDIVKKEAS